MTVAKIKIGSKLLIADHLAANGPDQGGVNPLIKLLSTQLCILSDPTIRSVITLDTLSPSSSHLVISSDWSN